MATKDGFQPDRSPIFLSEDAEKAEQPDIGKAWDIALISSRILKTSIFAVTAAAIGIAILSIGDPVALVANVTASWVDKPALQPDTDPSTSTIQSIASTQDLPPTTTDAPTRDEIAAAVEPAEGIRARPRSASHSLKPCSSNSRPGRPRKRHGHRSSPHNPCKLPAYRLCRMPQHRSSPPKSTDGSGPCKMREQRSGPIEIIEQGSGKKDAPDTDPARSGPPSTGAACAKCPDTVAPAKLRFALTQRHRNCASSARLSKMLIDCEVLYTPVFLARAKMTEASCFEGGIRCSRPSNGTPDITLANG